MGKRVQKTRETAARSAEETTAEVAAETETSDTRALTDDLLDEIDGVLEENAEAFVAAYVQKGGE